MRLAVAVALWLAWSAYLEAEDANRRAFNALDEVDALRRELHR